MIVPSKMKCHVGAKAKKRFDSAITKVMVVMSQRLPYLSAR